MRLDKLLSNRNYGTRKEVKKLVKSKNVLVNDIVITASDYNVVEGDLICIDEIEWEFNEFEYVVFNKPADCVSANVDKIHPTIFEHLPEDFAKTFHIVGRLDIDTEGLMIVTNDGEFIHKVISPNNHVGKVYEVHLKNEIDKSYIPKFNDGIIIDDDYKCMSAKLEIIDAKLVHLTIYEGKFHQVKKMFLAIGNEVVFLKRLSIGNLHLGTLPTGEYRMIAKDEIYNLCISKENRKD